MGSRQRPIGHPFLREGGLERRAFLRCMGACAFGLALTVGCGDDDSGASRHRRGTRNVGRPAPSVKPYDPHTPYWEQGNFARVEREVTATRLEVTGKVPSTLSGPYVRNGSNPPTGTSPHWFVGDGMLHGLRIDKGKASWYRNRYVGTTMHREHKSIKDAGIPGGDNNRSNVAVIHHAGKLLSLGEVGWPYEVSPIDLSTVGPWDYRGKLTTWMTAHPKIDPATGYMHFFGYSFTAPLLTYHVADAQGRLVHSEPVDIHQATMIHDFAITDRDVVFWQGPVMFAITDPELLRSGFPFRWDPKGPSQVGVMPLGGPASAIRWVDVDPFMVFHCLNAHREGDDVVVLVHKLSSAFGPAGKVPSYLTEWRINTAQPRPQLRERRLSDVDMDLPAIDRRHLGRRLRDGWCNTVEAHGPYGLEFAGINHIDLQGGRDDRWEPGPMERANEPFFVPHGDRAGEGEGWLLAFLYDRTVDRSSLGIFDAQAVADGPVARVHLPVRVPFGFHGVWSPDT